MAMHVMQVQLQDSLLSSLKFSSVRGTELAWIDGQLNCAAEGVVNSGIPILESVAQVCLIIISVNILRIFNF